MRVRALSATGDWLFGKGYADYLTGQAAIQQSIQTRILMFLNECFFATNAGLDWFTYLGSKNDLQIQLACAATILNTYGVTSVVQVYVNLTSTRQFSISYTVQTIFSSQAGQLVNTSAYLLTESGAYLDTEDGGRLIQG